MWEFYLTVTIVLAELILPGVSIDVEQDSVQCTPQQVHLSYGDVVTDIVVMWSTVGSCSTEVKYAQGKPRPLDQSAKGLSRMFDMASNENGTKVIHRAKLRDLSPGSTYFYQPISDKFSAGPFFFTIPSNDEKSDLNLMVLSDLNTTSPAIPNIVSEVDSGKYAALLHAGNIAMDLSTDKGEHGDSYMKLMAQAIRSVPYMTSPGPHEVEDDTFSHYIHRFSMPQSEWPISLDKMCYSLDIGKVHLISYSTEVFFTHKGLYASMQHDWLIHDLDMANKNREKVPWIVAFGHRPMYCSYQDPNLKCNQKTSKLKVGLEDIFYHYGVDIIIQSYGGAYERSLPMYKGVAVSDDYVDPLGPVHILTGAASPYDIQYNFTTPAPGWSAFRYTNDSIPTYGRLHIINASLAEYEQINTQDKSVIDSFKIFQNKHQQFSTDKLSPNISAKIDKEIVSTGGKPGVLNIQEIGKAKTKSKIAELLEGDNQTRLIIGVSAAAFIVIAILVVLFIKRFRKRRRVTRRWEQMDINYGKKFYSKAPDRDEDNDFEIDMSDGTEPTRKLLNADD